MIYLNKIHENKFIWNKKFVLPTKRATEEMLEVGLDMYKAIDILNNGFKCSRSRRSKNIIEKCIQKGSKIIKIVLVNKQDFYLLIHVGVFTISKKFRKMMQNET